MNTLFLNRDRLLKIFIPIALLLLNFILKIIYLDSTSIAGDEPFSIYHAQMDVSAIIAQLSQGNNPPLFEILLHFWIKLFGISAFSVRFLPFLFSTALVYFIYKIGISFFNARIAIIASLLFSFSNYHIFFSHEARVYPLFALLSTISMFAYLSLIKKENNNRYLSLLIVANILLCYAHYFGFFIPFIQLVCCLVFPPVRSKIFKKYLFASLLFIAAYIPNISVLINRFLLSRSDGWVSPVSYEDLYTMLWRFSNVPFTTVLLLTLLAAAVIKLFKNRFKNSSVYGKIIVVWFLLPYSLMFFVSMKYLPHNIPVFLDRYVIFISIAFYLSLAVAADYIFSNSRFNYIWLSIPVFLMLFTCKPNVDNKRPVAAAVEKIKELKTEKTIVFYTPFFFGFNFAYYYNIEYFKDYNPINPYENIETRLSEENIFPLENAAYIDSNLIVEAERIVCLTLGEISPADKEVLRYWKNDFAEVRLPFLKTFNVYVYEK
jgi:hypothetical protein